MNQCKLFEKNPRKCETERESGYYAWRYIRQDFLIIIKKKKLNGFLLILATYLKYLLIFNEGPYFYVIIN
jgi:hypothetical protein